MVPVLVLWFVVLLGLFGLARLRNAKKGLDADWQALAAFGQALQQFKQSHGHDEAAYAKVVALAPVLAAQTAVFAKGQGGDPFARMDQVRAAFIADEPNALDAFEAMRGRVLGYEHTLQTEMKILGKTSASPWVWLEAGARGLLLLPYGLVFASTIEGRARRRDLEADPRFRQAATLLLGVVVGGAFFVLAMTAYGYWLAFRHRVFD
jgi:hypothetical protein